MRIMNKILIKGCLLFLFFSALMAIASANPGIELTLTPREFSVQPGGTATYTVEVKSITTEPEYVTLSMEEIPPGFSSGDYTFDNPAFDLAPDETKTTILRVSVPLGVSLREYESKVKAEATVPGFPDFVLEKSFFTIITTAIPEFPNILIPVITSIGILLFFGGKGRK